MATLPKTSLSADDDAGSWPTDPERRARLPRKEMERLREEKPTSMRLFRRFIFKMPDGTIDVTRIHSRECFEAWVASRKVVPTEPEKSFQRTLSSHLTGVDGRVPFSPVEERLILALLRKKERWPCFADSVTRFGESGFRGQGFHERRLADGKGSDEINDAEEYDDDEVDYSQRQRTGPRRSKRPAVGVTKQLSSSSRDTETTSSSSDFEERLPARSTRKQPLPATSPVKSERIKRRRRDGRDGEDVGENDEDASKYEHHGSSLNISGLYPGTDEHIEGTDPDTLRSLMDQLIDEDDVPRMHAAAAAAAMPQSQHQHSPLSMKYMIQAAQAAHLAADPFPGAQILATLHNTFGNFAALSWDAWKKLLGICRMFLISTGFFHFATMEEAQALLDLFSARYPHDGVIIMDLTCADARDRFVAQNDISRQFLGRICRGEGGAPQSRIFDPKDSWHVLTNVLSAYRYKGSEVPIRCSLMCLGNVAIPFDCAAYIDPQSKLLVLRGHPIGVPTGAMRGM